MSLPLVCVHGFMGGQKQWHLQEEALGAERSLVLVALPGFGDLNGEPAISTINGLAKRVLAAVDAQGIMQFDLMGHSMGGMIVQEVIRLAPDRVRRLILYATGSIGVLPGRFETIEESKARGHCDGIQSTARRIAATWFLHGEAARCYGPCADIAAQTSPDAFHAGLEAMQSWSGQPDLPSIRSETLILWGDRDRTYPWSQTEILWQSIPHVHLAVVPGCAHAVHMEKPALFNATLKDFLEA
ncbi:alpha/beta fold hydrolase [Roseobacter litoralis]|nr:alpha/beta fold hydrolase [Roseobacter litoralis]